MTEEQSQTHNEVSWEEAVAKYLEEDPEFFARHPTLLAELNIPHVDRGEAESLIERQVSILRDKNRKTQQQLQDLVKVARENDALGERLHRVTVALCDAASLDDVMGSVQDMLRQDFSLDATCLRIKTSAEVMQNRPEAVPAGDNAFGALIKEIGSGSIACKDDLPAELAGYLFGDDADVIRSTALLALGGTAPWGLLALGSRDVKRFHPELGTVYLIRLGEIVTSTLQRFLR